MSIVSSSHILDFCRGLEAERRVSCQTLHYWTNLKKQDTLPRLGEVNFMDVPDLSENLFTIATSNGGGRFIIMTSSNILNDVCNGNPCGKTVFNAFPEPLNGSAVECCATAVDTHQPMVGSGTLILENGNEIVYRMIILPLSESGTAVDHLIGAISFRLET